MKIDIECISILLEFSKIILIILLLLLLLFFIFYFFLLRGYFLNLRYKDCTGTTPPRVPVFVRSNVLEPRIRGFNLVRPWALDLRTLRAHMCPVGLTALVQISLGTLPKLKDHNGTIMTRTANVIPCQSTLTRPGSADLSRRWIHRCSALPWEVTLLGRSPEVGSQFQCHFHHTSLPTKHPLSNYNIGPLIPLTTRVIIAPH